MAYLSFITILILSITQSTLALTHLHFFAHETVGKLPNATAVVVASLNNTSTGFGDIYVIDDELRDGPERNSSKLIGRAQGVVAQASLDGLGLLVSFNFLFTDGKYNDSTLAVIGRRALESSSREWSVVGGSGRFRMARGYVLGETVSYADGVLVIDFHVYVVST